MSDMTTTTTATAAGVEAAPTGELTELARLEIRVGKILEVISKQSPSGFLSYRRRINERCHDDVGYPMIPSTNLLSLKESHPEPK